MWLSVWQRAHLRDGVQEERAFDEALGVAERFAEFSAAAAEAVTHDDAEEPAHKMQRRSAERFDAGFCDGELLMSQGAGSLRPLRSCRIDLGRCCLF